MTYWRKSVHFVFCGMLFLLIAFQSDWESNFKTLKAISLNELNTISQAQPQIGSCGTDLKYAAECTVWQQSANKLSFRLFQILKSSFIRSNINGLFFVFKWGSQAPFQNIINISSSVLLKTKEVLDNNKSCWKCQKPFFPHKIITNNPFHLLKCFWHSCSSLNLNS